MIKGQQLKYAEVTPALYLSSYHEDPFQLWNYDLYSGF